MCLSLFLKKHYLALRTSRIKPSLVRGVVSILVCFKDNKDYKKIIIKSFFEYLIHDDKELDIRHKSLSLEIECDNYYKNITQYSLYKEKLVLLGEIMLLYMALYRATCGAPKDSHWKFIDEITNKTIATQKLMDKIVYVYENHVNLGDLIVSTARQRAVGMVVDYNYMDGLV